MGARFDPGVRPWTWRCIHPSGDMGFETVVWTDASDTHSMAGKTMSAPWDVMDVVPAGGLEGAAFFNGPYGKRSRLMQRGVLDNKRASHGMPLDWPLSGERWGFPSGIRYASSSDVTRKRVLRISDTICQKKKPPYCLQFTPDCKYPVVHTVSGKGSCAHHRHKEYLGTFFDFSQTNIFYRSRQYRRPIGY